MKSFVSLFVLLSSFATTPASAQAYPPNEAGVTMGHWHLNSQQVEANKKLFVALGGTAIKPGAFEIVRFPGVAVFLHQTPGAAAPTGGTEGTVINHVGFIVPDVAEAVARWRAAGVAVMPGSADRTDQAWIMTGEGLKVEILEDRSQTIPIRHHHVHFYVAENAIPEMQAWYVKHFGATPGMRGRNQAADIPGANLSFTKSDKPTVPTKGRHLDHIGFDVTDLAAHARKLQAAGISLEQQIIVRPDGSKLAFIKDPWGTLVELNQRAKPL
jgi:catechol 2,3-dioxygenase-like lactoylglutathione lyase family enzyme